MAPQIVLQAQLYVDYEESAAQQLLEALWQLDKQRLLGWLQQDTAQQDTVRLELAVFELLGVHWAGLDDAALCQALVDKLAGLGWALQLEGGRYMGFYKLLAHPDAAVRAKVQHQQRQGWLARRCAMRQRASSSEQQ